MNATRIATRRNNGCLFIIKRKLQFTRKNIRGAAWNDC